MRRFGLALLKALGASALFWGGLTALVGLMGASDAATGASVPLLTFGAMAFRPWGTRLVHVCPRPGEEIRATVNDEGNVDIRRFRSSGDGLLWPTKRGVTLGIPELRAILTEAEKAAGSGTAA